jgi:hypothetical protein
VTGKKPISVTVENQPPTKAGDEPLDLRASSMPIQPNTTYGKLATELILTTNKTLNGARVIVRCKGIINEGSAMVPGGSVQLGGGGRVDDHTFNVGIDSPNWAPGFPLVITLYSDSPVEPCQITPR